jgi:hypothetical protein
MSNTSYDTADAFGLLRSYSRHRDFVRLALAVVGQALERRGIAHDASKMLDDEFAGFSRINAAARIHKFGSPEYSEGMKRERGVIDQHFARTRTTRNTSPRIPRRWSTGSVARRGT